MALVEGEYEFTCDECNGDGSVQVIELVDEDTDEAQLVSEICEDCRGKGTVSVDETVAAEKILYGQTPIRTPAAT
jgi:DnaJ-class molecular chaperone